MERRKLISYCIDCGKEVSRPEYKRCKSCNMILRHKKTSFIGENNGNYKYGYYIKGIINHCIELNCHNKVSGPNRRCSKCAQKKERNGCYIDGRTYKKVKCKRCDAIISISNETKLCRKCSNKLHSMQLKEKYKVEEERVKFIKTMYKNRTTEEPNKFETVCGERLNNIFNNKFKYVGDRSLLINNKSPDFISDRLNMVVLCNGIYWHLLRKKLDNTAVVKEKIEFEEAKPFLNKNYDVMFIWEDDFSSHVIFKEIYSNEGVKYNQRVSFEDINWYGLENFYMEK
jgi:hypothetical protein